MPEVSKLCDVYRVRMFCDKCFKDENLVSGQGEMLFKHGITSPTPRMFHQCNSCGYQDFYSKKYPHIEYREIGREFFYKEPKQRNVE